MASKPTAPPESKSIFGENTIIELKYQNQSWKKGVILSSSRSNGIIIDLLMNNNTFKQIKLYDQFVCLQLRHTIIYCVLRKIDLKQFKHCNRGAEYKSSYLIISIV